MASAHSAGIWKNTPLCFASPVDSGIEQKDMVFVSNCATGGVEAIDLQTNSHLNVKWMRNLNTPTTRDPEQSKIDLFCAGNPLRFSCRSANGNGRKGANGLKSYSCVIRTDYLIFGDFECGIGAPQGVGFLVSKSSTNVLLSASWDMGDPSLWRGDLSMNNNQVKILFRAPATHADSIVFTGSKSDSGYFLKCNLFSDQEGSIDWCSNEGQFWRQNNRPTP